MKGEMNRKTFFDEIRPMFPRNRLNVGQVNRIDAVFIVWKEVPWLRKTLMQH